MAFNLGGYVKIECDMCIILHVWINNNLRMRAFIVWVWYICIYYVLCYMFYLFINFYFVFKTVSIIWIKQGKNLNCDANQTFPSCNTWFRESEYCNKWIWCRLYKIRLSPSRVVRYTRWKYQPSPFWHLSPCLMPYEWWTWWTFQKGLAKCFQMRG